MGDRSAYMSPGGYSAPSNPGGKSVGFIFDLSISYSIFLVFWGSSGGGGGYAREDYAWAGASVGGSSNNLTGGGGGGGATSSAGGVGKPKTDVSCYLGPK
uniref:Uncharacterized protein n=1 Tax=Ditylenchus dipsaci TaxID=166011 RepID=A0A915DVH0_9BILA